MEDDEYICPQGWRWNSIYRSLHDAWLARGDRGGIPEPPHLLPPEATDNARKLRWEETIEWAEAYGFDDMIPALAEDERYYHVSYAA